VPEPTPAATNRTRSRVPRGVRRVSALLASAVVTALAVLLAAPGTAWAGGPTSVLLVSPSTERAAAVYTSDPVYAELDALLAAPGAGVVGEPPEGPGQYVTLTWLVHDVSIWRIDRVFLDPVDGMRVVSRTSGENPTGNPADLSEGLWPGESGGPATSWYRPLDQGALAALFDRLGLLDPAVPDPSGDRAGVTAAELRAAAVPPAPAPETPARGDGPWWWAGAGALLGGIAALLGLRASSGLRRRLLPVPAPVER
jgi:hypothetical protein